MTKWNKLQKLGTFCESFKLKNTRIYSLYTYNNLKIDNIINYFHVTKVYQKFKLLFILSPEISNIVVFSTHISTVQYDQNQSTIVTKYNTQELK